jgi:hypothetical protein
MERTPQQRQPRHRARESEFSPAAFDRERAELIEAGITLAYDQHRDIDLATARNIAFTLATDPDSALAEFSRTGRLDNAAMRQEYLPILADPEMPPQVGEWIQRLGTLAVHHANGDRTIWRPGDAAPTLHTTLWELITGDEDIGEFSFRVRGDLPQEQLEPVMTRLIDLVRQHGTAMRIYLGLKDVDAGADNLEESFLTNFHGYFDSEDAVMRALSDLDDIEKAIEQLREQYLGAESVEIDTAWSSTTPGTSSKPTAPTTSSPSSRMTAHPTYRERWSDPLNRQWPRSPTADAKCCKKGSDRDFYFERR